MAEKDDVRVTGPSDFASSFIFLFLFKKYLDSLALFVPDACLLAVLREDDALKAAASWESVRYAAAHNMPLLLFGISYSV
jgi:hypothetical protein